MPGKREEGGYSRGPGGSEFGCCPRYLFISFSVLLISILSYPLHKSLKQGGIAQFRKYPIDSRAGATSCCERYPWDLRFCLRGGGRGVGMRWRRYAGGD